MPRITPQSAKAKGRRLQSRIVKDLQEALSLNDDDVRPAIMGETGMDIKLMSVSAREKVGLAIECKNTEKLQIWAALEQAAAHVGTAEQLATCVVFTRNRAKTYAVVEWEHLLKMLKLMSCSTDALNAVKLIEDSMKQGTV